MDACKNISQIHNQGVEEINITIIWEINQVKKFYKKRRSKQNNNQNQR